MFNKSSVILLHCLSTSCILADMNTITTSLETDRAATLLNIMGQYEGQPGWIMVNRGQQLRNGDKTLVYIYYAKYPWKRDPNSPELSLHRITRW